MCAHFGVFAGDSLLRIGAQFVLTHSVYTNERMKQWFVACVRENVNPHDDFNILLGKLLLSMQSGLFSQASVMKLVQFTKICLLQKPSPSHPARWNGIYPLSFLMRIDKAHPKLSTTLRQHDANKFLRYGQLLRIAACAYLHKSPLRYLLEKCEKSSSSHAAHTFADAFRFQVETRLRDCVSGRVSYESNDEFVMLILEVHPAYHGIIVIPSRAGSRKHAQPVCTPYRVANYRHRNCR
jgi:uncharacterized UBP type Zn finger protein